MRILIATLLCVFLFFPTAFSAQDAPEEISSYQLTTASDALPITLNQNWYFCPVQNYQPDVDVSVLDCKSIVLPGGWESVIPDYNGYGILYSQIFIPEDFSSIPLGIYVNKIRDADKTFVNGQLIGTTGEFPPNFDKGVLFSRLYRIPSEVLKFGENNLLVFWIYNDARPGGITYSLPVIDNYFDLVTQFYQNNLNAFALVVILSMFALLHFIYFAYHRQSKENLFYGIFLVCWSAYIYLTSNLPLATGLSLSWLFRLNVAFFYMIYSLFPVFIYQFFQQKMPLLLKLIIGLALLLVPFCFLLPEAKLLYYPLEVIEVFTLPALAMIYYLLFKAIRAQLAYAKLMSTVIVLYTLLGLTDILIDLTQSVFLQTVSLYGPWGLILLSLALTLIMAHKNLVYYRDATVDRLTNALRFPEFLSRLELELFRADREKNPIVIIMVDMDDFKLINDRFGHMQGDKVLVSVADSLRSQLRHFDLLGRYGGDEFCVAAILENRTEIINFVKRLHTSVNELVFEKRGHEFSVSVTFGAVIREVNTKISPKALVESADNLLIHAKSNAKGTIHW